MQLAEDDDRRVRSHVAELALKSRAKGARMVACITLERALADKQGFTPELSRAQVHAVLRLIHQSPEWKRVSRPEPPASPPPPPTTAAADADAGEAGGETKQRAQSGAQASFYDDWSAHATLQTTHVTAAPPVRVQSMFDPRESEIFTYRMHVLADERCVRESDDEDATQSWATHAEVGWCEPERSATANGASSAAAAAAAEAATATAKERSIHFERRAAGGVTHTCELRRCADGTHIVRFWQQHPRLAADWNWSRLEESALSVINALTAPAPPAKATAAGASASARSAPSPSDKPHDDASERVLSSLLEPSARAACIAAARRFAADRTGNLEFEVRIGNSRLRFDPGVSSAQHAAAMTAMHVALDAFEGRKRPSSDAERHARMRVSCDYYWNDNTLRGTVQAGASEVSIMEVQPVAEGVVDLLCNVRKMASGLAPPRRPARPQPPPVGTTAAAAAAAAAGGPAGGGAGLRDEDGAPFALRLGSKYERKRPDLSQDPAQLGAPQSAHVKTRLEVCCDGKDYFLEGAVRGPRGGTGPDATLPPPVVCKISATRRQAGADREAALRVSEQDSHYELEVEPLVFDTPEAILATTLKHALQLITTVDVPWHNLRLSRIDSRAV